MSSEQGFPGWDARAWDEATGRADIPSGINDGHVSGVGVEDDGSWLAPPSCFLAKVSDSTLIRSINQEGLGWIAGPSVYFEGEPFLSLRRSLGARGLEQLSGGDITQVHAALPPSPHLGALVRAAATTTMPRQFDAREAWPDCAEQIGRIRNQGGCGYAPWP